MVMQAIELPEFQIAAASGSLQQALTSDAFRQAVIAGALNQGMPARVAH
jgi:hypothetical protein